MKLYIKWIAGIGAGAVTGFLYWYYIGCTGGSCALTSTPVSSTLYGSVMGALFVNAFSRPSAKNHDKF